MRFAVLGPVRVWRDGEEIRLGAAQQRLLLALLMAHAGRPVAMEELQQALWGESPPGSPANAVYRHIGVLRRLLEPELPLRAPGRWLVRDAGGYRLRASPETLDVLRLRELVRQARQGGARGAEAAVPLLLEALHLRTGAVATGVPVEARSHPAFNALEREHLAVVKEAADVVLAVGAAGQLLAVLHRAAAEHPLDEQLQARFVRALAATGQRAAALDTWQRVRTVLATELGVEPGAELRSAQREILNEGIPPAPLQGPTEAARRAVVGPSSDSRVPADRLPAGGTPADSAPGPTRTPPADTTAPPAPAVGRATGATGPTRTTSADRPAAPAPPAPAQTEPPPPAPRRTTVTTAEAEAEAEARATATAAAAAAAAEAEAGARATATAAANAAEAGAEAEAEASTGTGANARARARAVARLSVVPEVPERPAIVGTSAPHPPDPFVRPAQLPADLATFAGRRAELARVVALSAADAPGMRIAVVSGMGGIGKTTLAVRWAHRIAHRFPDGQLYVNLRGFDPGGTATDPGEALRGFLEGLGVPPQRMPAGTDAQTGLYRSLLARRRVLILLDNARSAEQVRPLLPGSPGCMVVVTSRDRLLGLVTAEAAHPVALDRLPPAEARESLVRRLGAERVSAEPAAVEEIVARCAGLPLALAVVATRAATHPGFPLAAIAADLREARDSLDAFADSDPAGDVRAVLSCSYRALSPPAARLLRLLSLHPGPDVTVPAAAAVADGTPAAARRLLTELTGAHLLTEHAPGRFSCHDLLRTYAMELAAEHDGTAGREAAVRRTLDHYLHTAHTAARLYSPWFMASSLSEAAPGARPESFADDGQALRWYTAERRVLHALAASARERGHDGHVWRLAWALERFMDR
ncbi:AfsR/SARP family transcriptional regulator, partial [Streptomyces sp. NPDC002920]